MQGKSRVDVFEEQHPLVRTTAEQYFDQQNDRQSAGCRNGSRGCGVRRELGGQGARWLHDATLDAAAEDRRSRREVLCAGDLGDHDQDRALPPASVQVRHPAGGDTCTSSHRSRGVCWRCSAQRRSGRAPT